jgi:hypothetical protein
MRCFAKLTIYAFACLFSCSSFGQALIPGTPNSSYGGDEVKGRDGTMCKQGSISRPTLDFGTIVSNDNGQTGANMPQQLSDQTYQNLNSTAATSGRNFSIYARVVIPLGKEVPRVDCTRIYELEVQRLQEELKRLKDGAASATLEVK